MRIPAGGDGDAMRGGMRGGGGGGGGGGALTTSWPIPGPAAPKAEALMLFIRHEEHPGVPAGISRELVGDVLLAGRWRWRCDAGVARGGGGARRRRLYYSIKNNQREYPFFPCTCMSFSFITVCAWHFCFILCAFICRRQSPHLTSFSHHPWPSTSAAMPYLSYRPAPLCTAWLPLQPEHGMLSLQS